MVIIIVTVSKGEKKIGLITAKKIISTSMEQISGCAFLAKANCRALSTARASTARGE